MPHAPPNSITGEASSTGAVPGPVPDGLTKRVCWLRTGAAWFGPFDAEWAG